MVAVHFDSISIKANFAKSNFTCHVAICKPSEILFARWRPSDQTKFRQVRPDLISRYESFMSWQPSQTDRRDRIGWGNDISRSRGWSGKSCDRRFVLLCLLYLSKNKNPNANKLRCPVTEDLCRGLLPCYTQQWCLTIKIFFF